MTEVVPAIIPKRSVDIKEDALKVRDFVEGVQIDIMDGKYTPEPCWPFTEHQDGIAEELNHNLSQELRIGFELDMMVHEPGRFLDAWSNFGVHLFLLHFHSVETHELHELIGVLREKGKDVGIAIKPSTGIDALEPFIEKIDQVQVMGSDQIGFHGVLLDERVPRLINDLRNRHKELIISVDIGVNFETAPKLVEAGVSKLVSGSAIYGSPDIGEAIRKLSLS